MHWLVEGIKRLLGESMSESKLNGTWSWSAPRQNLAHRRVEMP